MYLWPLAETSLPSWQKADRPYGTLLFSLLSGTDDTFPLFQKYFHNQCAQLSEAPPVGEHSHHTPSAGTWQLDGDRKIFRCPNDVYIYVAKNLHRVMCEG